MTHSTIPVRLHGWALALGASSGFGAATARALASAGLDLFGVHLDRRATLPNAERVVAEVEALGRRARFFNVNAADPDRRAEVVAAMAKTLAEHGETGQLCVLLHSLAFGTLRAYVTDQAGQAATASRTDLPLDAMAPPPSDWTRAVAS